ncbi:MAG: hypothetical protein QW196_05900, partial [Sulfolobales archaeon]
VYKAKRVAFTDLATRLGAPRKDLEDAVARLHALGYIEVEREGNRKVLVYVKGLFKGLKHVAPSEEGYRIARRVLLKYYGRGYVVLPVKQDPSIKARPDLVAVPVDKSTWRPLYSSAVAIEIESCNELETHPEHVVRNWVKESTKDFLEVHSWTSKECFSKLQVLYGRHLELREKVKVFSVRIRSPKHSTGVIGVPLQSNDVRTRFVDIGGRRYRIIFKSMEDARRFDVLSRQSGVFVYVNEASRSVVLFHRVVGKRIVLSVENIEVA